MPDQINPYQSPETAASPVAPLLAQGALTENMLIYLKGASPWLRFIGILGFVSAGLTVMWGFVSFTPIIRGIWAGVPGFEWLGVFGGGMALLSFAGGVLIFLPSLFIYRFGKKIRGYLRTGVDQELEQAFENNKSFWKFAGIICIIYLAFVPALIVGSVIVALVSAFS